MLQIILRNKIFAVTGIVDRSDKDNQKMFAPLENVASFVHNKTD